MRIWPTLTMEKVKEEFIAKKQSVEKYNINEVKTYLDDALIAVVEKGLFFQQSHTHMDIKLFLGYCAGAAAVAIAFYNQKVDFFKGQFETLCAIIVYFIFSSLYTVYTMFIEKDVVFVGEKKGNESKSDLIGKVSLSTKLPNEGKIPEYIISASLEKSNKLKKTANLKKAITKWIDVDGFLDIENFTKDINNFMQSLSK
jgi:signal peptidase complex subunit 2